MIMSIDVTALPSELLVTPLPLIGFSGLDITHNAIHKSIWDAFNTNRKIDRAAVQFKLLPANYEFPTAKPKRPSYEWYQPKGILKRNWMLKHLQVVPAVVVLFQELEWNDPQWSEKQMQCVSAMQALRTALQERQTRLCLVILQKASNVPVGDDVLSTERMTSLTSACNINNKMLFILPHSEHLMGYILRLESAFLDMAQAYYALMSRRIRTHRDQLTTAHITLKIRHQFKLGFVAEIRQDFNTSLKHYSQAYSHLNEIRIVDSNCLEVKTIAGFLNYKICRLMFKMKVPRDSINHFISHIEKYKNYTGYKDLIFEHYAWLSTQHSVFAELFCEAIKNGLPALQTQHPGIYFHKAAEYTLRRKEAFLQTTAILASPSDTNNLTAQNNLSGAYSEFYGIRTAKSGELISEQLTALIRTNEKSFNHSSTIINLLGLAMAQFKIYKCLRFRKKLAIDMAEEYFKSGDHAKALTLYSLMLPDYRTDNWAPIFSDVLLKTLRSAQLAASVTDYVCCCIESLSFKIRSDQKTRITVLENLWKVFQGVPPVSQYQITPEIRDLWENALISPKTPIHISLDKISELIEVHATFEQSKLKNDEQIKVLIIIKLLTDVPIKINTICSLLSDGTNTYKLPATKYIELDSLDKFRDLHDATAMITSDKDKELGKLNATTKTTIDSNYKMFDINLKLEPEIYYEFVCTTEAQQFLENTELRILRTEILMGTNKLSAILAKTANYNRNPFRSYNRHKNLEDNIVMSPICNITPTFHLNTQTNFDKDTMLVNEYYAITTTVFNPHNVFLRNVGLNVSVPNNLRNKGRIKNNNNNN